VSATTTVPSTEARDEDAVTRWILADAAISGAAGTLLAAGGAWLDGVLGAPAAVLVPLGLFLLAYAAALVLVARAGCPKPAVLVVIAGNATWVVASVVAVLADWLTLTTAGTVVALAQAAAVALVAEMQTVALKRRVN
jgi:hypothetical protein